MNPHTRTIIAAAAYAFIVGKKVAGLHEPATGQDFQIAAESHEDQLQGFDGDRGAKFGGTLPELYDAGDKAFISFEIEGTTARGYDRATSGFFTANVIDRVVQVYDHNQSTWFTFTVQGEIASN